MADVFVVRLPRRRSLIVVFCLFIIAGVSPSKEEGASASEERYEDLLPDVADAEPAAVRAGPPSDPGPPARGGAARPHGAGGPSDHSRETRRARAATSGDVIPQYVIDQNDVQLTEDELERLPPDLQGMLGGGGSTRTLRGIQTRSLSISSPSASLTYYEDSDPLALLPNQVELISSEEVEYILVLLINVLDGEDEVLGLETFTVTHTTDVGGRNVTFDYDVTPTYTYENSILNLTGLASTDEYRAAIGTLTYRNLAEEVTATLRGAKITVYDSSSTASMNVFFRVESVNDSPFFSSQPSDVTIEEGSSLFTTVSSTSIELLGNSIRDPDFGSVLGVAVLGADNSHGSWYYGDRSGLPVLIPDGIRDADGNILRETSLVQTCVVLKEHYISFVPEPDFTGNSSITVVAWDRTGSSSSLSHGDYANVTWTQQGDPFGQDMATVKVIVTSIEDAPHVALTSSPPSLQIGTVEEDTVDDVGVMLATLLEACDDVDLTYDSSKANIGVAISAADSANGDWQYTTDAGVNWSALDNLSVLLGTDGDVTSSRVRFLPIANYYGAAEIKFRCWDFSAGSSGDEGVDSSFTDAFGAFSELEVTAILIVTNVNDRPYFAQDASVQLPVYADATMQNERGSKISELTASAFQDEDPTDLPGVAVVGLEENDFGQFQYTCDDIDDSNVTSSTARWFSLYSAHGAGYTPYVQPSLDRATVLGPQCSLRFIQSSSASTISAHLNVIAWDQSDGTPDGSYEVNVTSAAGNAYGSGNITLDATLREVLSRPVVTGAADQLQFTEGDSPLVLFDDVTITNLASSLGQSASVTLTNPQDGAGEMLSIGSSPGFGNEQDLVAATGLDVTWNADMTSVTFTGEASDASYATSLRSLTYAHHSDDPTTSIIRRIRVVVTDATGTNSPEHWRNVSVHSVNDPPHVTVSADVSSSWQIVDFRRGSSAVFLYGSDVTIGFTDLDQSAPSSVVVSMDTAYDGSNEALAIPATVERRTDVTSTHYEVEILQVTSNYDVSNNALTFSLAGLSVTSSDYTQTLQFVTYSNAADPPDFRHRTVRLHAIDAFDARTDTVNVTVNVLESDGSVVIGLPGGSLPGTPVIAQVVASPLTVTTLQRNTADLHTDAKVSSGDTVRVIFDRDTNMPPFGYYDVTDPVASRGKTLGKTSIDELFTFQDAIALETSDSYSGEWASARVFEITIVREGYPQPSLKVGEWRVSAKYRVACYESPDSTDTSQDFCIRDATGRSNVSLQLSPPLEGNWGLNVPDLSSIITRGDTVTSGISYVTDGTTNVVSLRPALSLSQLSAICSLGYSGLFGSDLWRDFPGLSASLTSCTNKYVSEWDVGLDRSGEIPTVSILVVTFQPSQAVQRSQDVSANMATNFNKSALIAAVADDTGVDRTILTDYVAAQPATTRSILLEHDISLTPTVIASSISRPASSDVSSDDVTIRSDDIIAIVFSRPINEPPVEGFASLQKILSIDPSSVANYVSQWTNDVTLQITLLDVTTAVTSLSVSFNRNRFSDGSFVPDDFVDNPHCIGAAVCGDDDVSVGVCDVTSSSCRARGNVTVHHTTVDGASSLESSASGDVAWWWLLLIGLLLLVACIFIACLVCVVRKQRKNKKKKSNKQYDEYKSIPATTPTNSLFLKKTSPLSWRPSSRPSTSEISVMENGRFEPSKSHKSTPLSSRSSRKIAPAGQSPVFSVSGSNYDFGDAVLSPPSTASDYQRKVHFAPPPLVPLFQSGASSRGSTPSLNDESVGEKQNIPEFHPAAYEGEADDREGSPEMKLSSHDRSVMNLRSRMVYDEPGPPDVGLSDLDIGGPGFNNGPLIKRSSSAQMTWRRAIAMVTDSLTDNEAGASGASRRSRRSLNSLCNDLSLEGTSESGYVPSFSSDSQPSLRSGKLSSLSTIGDLPDKPTAEAPVHRSSISGLPMTWYVGPPSLGDGDATMVAEVSPRRVSSISLGRSPSRGLDGLEVAEGLLER